MSPSYYAEKSPKYGFVNALCSSVAADFNMLLSTLSRGRNRKLPPSTLSNPHSSRNFTPSSNFPTLSCWKAKKHTLINHVKTVGREGKRGIIRSRKPRYLEYRIAEADLSELDLVRILEHVFNIDRESLECSRGSGIVDLKYQMQWCGTFLSWNKNEKLVGWEFFFFFFFPY